MRFLTFIMAFYLVKLSKGCLNGVEHDEILEQIGDDLI